MTPHRRPPLLGRILTSLIVGPDAEVLRGDLEESYQRCCAERGDSLRSRAAYVVDALSSAARWWASRMGRRPVRPSVEDNSRRDDIMAAFGPELRQMWRGLLRRPGYAGMVALTLGLGIGATTTIYSVVDAMLVRPLPYRDADRLVIVGNTMPGAEWLEGREGLQRIEDVALPNFRDLRDRARVFQRTAAIERGRWMVADGDSPPELVDVSNVEDGFFDLLSVKPLLGRLPRGGDRPGAGRAVGHCDQLRGMAASLRRRSGRPRQALRAG